MASTPRAAPKMGIIGWRPPSVVVLVGRIGLLLVAVWLLALVRNDVPIYVYFAAVAVPLVGIWAIVRKGVDLKVWAIYIVGFVLFAQLRTLSDEVGIATQIAYPIDAEKAIFFGTVPTVWLQDHFYTFTQVGILDALTIIVYATYFIFPHLVVFAAWRLDRKHFPAYAAGVVGAVYIGLVVSLLVPTAPPWLAAQTGDLPHVFRVLEDISQEVAPGTYALAYDVAGPNDVAAMPSLHVAVPAVIAAIAWSRARRPLGVAAWLYVAAMAFSLVYLGEHYVVDVLAGLGVAAVVTAGITLWLRMRGKERPGVASDSDTTSRSGGP